MKIVTYGLISFLFIALCSCNNRKTIKLTEADQEAIAILSHGQNVKKLYSIINADTAAGQYRGVILLLNDSTKLDTATIKEAMLQGIKFECHGNCSTVTLWSSRHAYELSKNYGHDELGWERDWPYICEHMLALYYFTGNGPKRRDVKLYSMMDEQYEQLGGKKPRPKPEVIMLDFNQKLYHPE